MRGDDARHGSVAGYNAHRRSDVTPCDPCRRAKMRYEKARILAGGSLKVPATGTRRRIQALRALGYSLAELSAAGGWQTEHAAFKYPMTAETITRGTADRVAELYERLCMTLAAGPRASHLRAHAARVGWLPPLAWDDIDRDPDPSHDFNRTTHLLKEDMDHVIVDRVLSGVNEVMVTTAERREIVRRWPATGRPLAELARLTGWKVERYVRREAA